METVYKNTQTHSISFTIGIVGLVFLNSVIGEMKNIKFKDNLTLY